MFQGFTTQAYNKDMEHLLIFITGFLKKHNQLALAESMLADPAANKNAVMRAVTKIENKIVGNESFDFCNAKPLPYRSYEDAAVSFVSSLMGGDYPDIDSPDFEYAEIGYTAARAHIYDSIVSLF